MTDNDQTPEVTEEVAAETPAEEAAPEAEEPQPELREAEVNAANEALLAEIDREIEGGEPNEPEQKEEAAAEEGEEPEVKAEEVEEPAPAPKKKQTAKERIKELSDAKKLEAAEKEAAELRAQKAEQELAELRKLVKEKLTEPEKEEEVDDDFDPVDEEAFKRTNERIDQIEAKRDAEKFLDQVKAADTRFTQSDENWALKKNAVIADEANTLVMLGEAASEAEAIEMAKSNLADQMHKAYKNGKDVGDFMQMKAQTLMKKIGAKEKKEKETNKADIDMVELNELRDSAGAPNNKIAPTKGGGADLLTQIDAEIAEDAKKDASAVW